MADINAIQSINNRVWYVEGGVHPARPPQFLSLGKISSDPKQTIGEEKKISAPDPNRFGSDITLGSMKGERERATLSVGVRTTTQKSILMNWKNKNCRVDIFVLSGKCGNPQDFTEGGEFWVFFPDGKISSHAFENLGAFGLDENNPTNESVDMTAEDYWQYLYMRQEYVASANTIREVYTVDTWTGGDCDTCPDACQNVYMTMAGVGATPGTIPSLLYSSDGGDNFSTQNISSMFSNESINDSAVIGSSLVLVSGTSNSMHWTDLSELKEGNNTWLEVVNGFVASKSPNALSSSDVRHTWIVGNGGYIYFAANHKTGVTVQDPGVATSQNLNAIHALSSQSVLTVGNSNAVVYTTNGGSTWESVTGPSVGVNLGACWMWNSSTWLIGEGAGGNGRLWLTINSGLTWTQINLPNNYSRIYKIVFSSEAEGFISAQAGGQSYILRTITAGNEWTVLPQGKRGVALSNGYLRDIEVCSKYGNTAFAVGLAANLSAGVAIKMAG